MTAPIATAATHGEQQFLEVAGQLFSLETAELAKDTPAILDRRITIDPDLSNSTVTIVATLPVTPTVDADGGISFDVNEVLP